MITFTLCAVGFLGLTYLMHEAHKRDRASIIADCDALLDEQAAEHRAEVAEAADTLAAAEQQLADDATMLTVAAAEIDRLTLGRPLAKVVALRGGAS